MCSWNARALFLNRGSCTAQAAAKVSHWRKLVDSNCMVGVQEAHGNFAEVKHHGDRMLQSHFLAWSPIEREEIYNNQDCEHKVSSFAAAGKSDFESESENESVFSQSSLGGVSCESGCDSPKENLQNTEQELTTSEKPRDVRSGSCPRGGGCISAIKKSSFSAAAVCEHHHYEY